MIEIFVTLAMVVASVLGDQDQQSNDNKRIICIFPNWSTLRESSISRIQPEDIDPFLCTHIHYAYANIDIRNMQLVPSQYQDYNRGEQGDAFYSRIMKLRERNPKLKVLISIGGWFAKSIPFNRILQTNHTRAQFIENTLNFIRHWRFDGLDLNWQYPGALDTGATNDSKGKFTHLVYHLARAFKDEEKSNFKKYLLSAYVSGNDERINDGYDVRNLCKHLSYVSVATFDYVGPFDTRTGHNAPLYSRGVDKRNVNSSIYSWLDRGCPANKLLVGIPTYARTFKIASNTMLHMGLPAEPLLDTGLYTNEEGILSYYEVCELLSTTTALPAHVTNTKIYWDDVANVPFAILNRKTMREPHNVWLTFEDSHSARKKAEYVRNMSLGGVHVWQLDMDDFKGMFCNLGAYPIIEAIKQELVTTPGQLSFTKSGLYSNIEKAKQTTAFSAPVNVTKLSLKPLFNNGQLLIDQNRSQLKQSLRKIRIRATIHNRNHLNRRHSNDLVANGSSTAKYNLILVFIAFISIQILHK